MSLTGSQLLSGLSAFIDDVTLLNLTTSAAGTTGGDTLVDSDLGAWDDDFFVDWWVRITSATAPTNQYTYRRVVKFESVSGQLEVRPAFPAQVAASITYELHRYDPAKKFSALDAARFTAYPDLATIVYDDTLCGDGISKSFDIPAGMRRGPAYALLEQAAPPEPDWNHIPSPRGDSVSGWTASSLTLTTYDRPEHDTIIPKYDYTCAKFTVAGSTNGTATLVVGSMVNGITATASAGRRVTFGMWVWCETADRISLKILDDSGTLATSSFHQGKGWELLTIEGVVSPTNATTLSARLDVSSASAAVVGFWNRAWFYLGDASRIRDIYAGDSPRRVRRDDTTNRIYFEFPPGRGQQIRLVGTDHLSALGSTVATQVTNTMEVDEATAEVLYAEAAKVLFNRLRLNLSDFSEVNARIATAEQMRGDLSRSWRMSLPPGKPFKSRWAS